MFHHVKGLVVENLTKCKLVHHITPRNKTKCAILIHKEYFFHIFLWMIVIKRNKISLRKGWCKPIIMFHHRVNTLMVANLTKRKPVHHITPRGAYKMCHPCTHKRRFFHEIGDYHTIMIHQLLSESKTKCQPTVYMDHPIQ